MNERKDVDAKNEYLLLIRCKAWWNSLALEGLQKTMDHVKARFERLTESGQLKAAQPLAREGTIVSGKTGRMIADGPFTKSREVIGGYFLLDVATMGETVATAKECPGLAYGEKVEVRRVRAECLLASEAEAQLAEATA